MWIGEPGRRAGWATQHEFVVEVNLLRFGQNRESAYGRLPFILLWRVGGVWLLVFLLLVFALALLLRLPHPRRVRTSF